MAVNLIFIVIGTAFGVEWRHHRFDSSPYPSKHFFYHVVAPYQDGLSFNCGRTMPVTEMPGDPVQVVRRSASHLNQVLGCRLHGNPAATFQCKAVTVAQGRRFFEIEENRRLVIANKPDAPPMPLCRGARAGLEWESSESKIMMWNQNLTKATRCI